jgi:hypothetical protein
MRAHLKPVLLSFLSVLYQLVYRLGTCKRYELKNCDSDYCIFILINSNGTHSQLKCLLHFSGKSSKKSGLTLKTKYLVLTRAASQEVHL